MKLYVCLALFIVFGCKDQSQEWHLESGLDNYEIVRHIDGQLIAGYPIQKLAIFKKDSSHYNFVYLLGKDAIKDSINAYSLGLVVFPTQEYMPKDKTYIIWSFQPNIETINTHKYIRTAIETKIKRMDSLHIFLFNRDGYKEVLGDNMFYLKNIKL